MKAIHTTLNIDPNPPARVLVSVPSRWLMICMLITLLALPGCARSPGGQYPPPPSTVNVTADANARALRGALSLQKFTRDPTDAGSYRIGSNDVLEIKVFEQPNMNVTTRVSENGMINFPPLGDILAAGKNERQLEGLLQDRLRGAYIRNPHVTAFIREVQARMFGIIGAVNLPGQYSSFGPMRLADLIAKAGGLKPEAGEVAYVMHYKLEPGTTNPPAAILKERQDSTETVKVDLDGLLRRGDRVWNVALEANDLVNIPAAGTVFITGSGITKPGTYPLTTRMTLQQLVDLAEGLKFEAKHQLLLVRTMENGAKDIYKVDYDQLRQERTAEIQLRVWDKVVVDRTLFKTIIATIGRGMGQVFHVFVSANYQFPLSNEDKSSAN